MAEHRHGHSVAAWTAVTILLVASAIMSLAVVLASVWMFVAGGVLVLVGVIAGKVLAMAGFGQHKPETEECPTLRVRSVGRHSLPWMHACCSACVALLVQSPNLFMIEPTKASTMTARTTETAPSTMPDVA